MKAFRGEVAHKDACGGERGAFFAAREKVQAKRARKRSVGNLPVKGTQPFVIEFYRAPLQYSAGIIRELEFNGSAFRKTVKIEFAYAEAEMHGFARAEDAAVGKAESRKPRAARITAADIPAKRFCNVGAVLERKPCEVGALGAECGGGRLLSRSQPRVDLK